MKNYNPIIFAIDLNDFEKTVEILKEVHDYIGMAKFGLEFFYHFGTEGLKKINVLFPDLKIFLDLKFYDIPVTVCKSLHAFKDIKNLYFLTLHASGGEKMLLEAKKTLREICLETKILAVTKLTSFELDLNEIFSLAENAILKGEADGLIAPASTANDLKNRMKSKDFLIVSPGIRLAQELIENDDQKAIMDPKKAIQNGSDYLVIGRPIMKSNNKRELLKSILKDINF